MVLMHCININYKATNYNVLVIRTMLYLTIHYLMVKILCLRSRQQLWTIIFDIFNLLVCIKIQFN